MKLEPIGISNWINIGKKYGYDKYVAGLLVKNIIKAKEDTQIETGAFKYDFAYNEIIEIIKKQNEKKRTNI